MKLDIDPDVRRDVEARARALLLPKLETLPIALPDVIVAKLVALLLDVLFDELLAQVLADKRIRIESAVAVFEDARPDAPKP
jgi:hypothetical protein